MKRKEKIRIKGSDVILASSLIHANVSLDKLMTFSPHAIDRVLSYCYIHHSGELQAAKGEICCAPYIFNVFFNS